MQIVNSFNLEAKVAAKWKIYSVFRPPSDGGLLIPP